MSFDNIFWFLGAKFVTIVHSLINLNRPHSLSSCPILATVQGMRRIRRAQSSTSRTSKRSRSAVHPSEVGRHYEVDDDDGYSQGYHTTTSYPPHQLTQTTIDTGAPPPMDEAMVCVTVVQDGSTLAFACFDEERNEIILECARCQSNDQESVIERFWDLTKPTLLLLGTNILNNASLLQTLTKQANSIEMDENATTADEPAGDNSASIPYRLMKSKSLELQSCKTRILQKLRVRSLLRETMAREHAPAYSERQQRAFPASDGGHVFRPSSYHSLAALIDFDSKAQIQALGCLISYLQESLFRLAMEGVVTVDRIVLAKSHQYMRIDASTLHSLHIFSTEHHPLQGNSKEGWSLFSLLDRTKSKGGRKLLKEWMLRPLVDLPKIEQRQDAVQLFLELQTQAGIILQFLGKIGPVDSILLKLQKCSTQPNDFLVLIKTLSSALSIASSLKDDLLPRLDPHQDQWQYWNHLLERCHGTVLYHIQERIMDVLDEEAMLEQGGLIIRRGFHPQLDEWRDQYEDLDGKCRVFVVTQS